MRYPPLAPAFLAILLGLLVGVAVLIQIGILQYAYGRLGIGAGTAFLILGLELVGSLVNIPVPGSIPSRPSRSGGWSSSARCT